MENDQRNKKFRKTTNEMPTLVYWCDAKHAKTCGHLIWLLTPAAKSKIHDTCHLIPLLVTPVGGAHSKGEDY